MDDILSELLPTKWSRRVATISLTLVMTVPFFYEGLQKLGMEFGMLKAPSVRLLLGALVAVVGLLILLVLAIRHIHELNTQLNSKGSSSAKSTPKETVRLNELEEKLLLLLCNHGDMTSAQVASVLIVGEQLITYHFTELENRRLVHGSYSTIYETEWSIAHGGRSYLAKHGLLK